MRPGDVGGQVVPKDQRFFRVYRSGELINPLLVSYPDQGGTDGNQAKSRYPPSRISQRAAECESGSGHRPLVGRLSLANTRVKADNANT